MWSKFYFLPWKGGILTTYQGCHFKMVCHKKSSICLDIISLIDIISGLSCSRINFSKKCLISLICKKNAPQDIGVLIS